LHGLSVTVKPEQMHVDERNSDAIDLRAILVALWSGKWLIGSLTFAFAVIAVIVTLLLPNTYRAYALLAPNDREDATGLASLAAQYGGLASLAGLELTDTSADKTNIGLEVLKSRRFISEFIERHEALVPLMAVERWDFDTRQLVVDDKIYDASQKQWTRKVRPPRQVKPSLQEAYEEFVELLTVTRDKNTGIIRLSIEHQSPDVAKDWVLWLVEDLNQTIMQQDVVEAEQAIAYLNEQIEKTSLAGLKDVFFSLIEEQTKTVMLAQVSDEYLFKTIDPPVAPEEKASPKRLLIVSLASIVGFFLSILIVLIIASFQRGTSPPNEAD
jgi:uncharacterized protein involved in exopolysaccharide biosynthesis